MAKSVPVVLVTAVVIAMGAILWLFLQPETTGSAEFSHAGSPITSPGPGGAVGPGPEVIPPAITRSAGEIRIFANAKERVRAVPDAVGQRGTQVDDGSAWMAVATKAGEWVKLRNESSREESNSSDAGRVLIKEIAEGAKFHNYRRETSAPSTRSTAGGSNAWRDSSFPDGDNEWNGTANINVLMGPSQPGTGVPMQSVIEGLAPGREYSLWGCVMIHSGRPTVFRGRFGRVSRGGTTELWTAWDHLGAERGTSHVLDGFGKVLGESRYIQLMVFLGNFAADSDGKIAIEFDDAGEFNFYLAGYACGRPLPDGLPRQPDGILEPRVHVVAEDGAWTWFNDPRCVVLPDGKWLVGVVDRGGKSSVINYDPISRIAVKTELSSFAEFDDHGNPALIETTDGGVLAAYCRHNAQEWHWRVSSVASPRAGGDWGAERSNGREAVATYARLLKDSKGNLWAFYRRTGGPAVRGWWVRKSTDHGSTWGTAIKLLGHSTSPTPPYARFAIDSTDRIHILFSSEAPNVAMGGRVYHVTFDGAVIRASNGEVIKAVSRGCLVADKEMGRYPSSRVERRDTLGKGNVWVSDLAVDANDQPVAVYTSFKLAGKILQPVPIERHDDDQISYYYARWLEKEARWEASQIAWGGNGISGGVAIYAAELILDPHDPARVVLGSNSENPFEVSGRQNLRRSKVHEIWEGARRGGGNEFSWKRLTETAPPASNFRPFLLRDEARSKSVLFWLRGTYADDRSEFQGHDMSFGSIATRVMAMELD